MINKRIIFVIILLINIYKVSYCINQVPENIYSGYAYVAGVYTVNAAVINPANLYYLNKDEIYITFNKPFIFHSTIIGFPFGKNRFTALGILANESFHQYRAGINLLNYKHFKLGISSGIDREIQKGGNNRFGFILSPGFTFPIVKKEDKDFGIDLAANWKNALAFNSFKTYKERTADDVDIGIRTELFIQHLFFNTGFNYFQGESKYSISLEYLLSDVLNIGVVYKDKKFGCGFTLNLKKNYIGFAYIDNSYSISYHLTLGKAKIFKKRYHGPKITKEHLRIQRSLLNRGIKLYKEKKYDEAKKVWKGVIRIAPTTEYAKEARKYIKKVDNILRSLEE